MRCILILDCSVFLHISTSHPPCSFGFPFLIFSSSAPPMLSCEFRINLKNKADIFHTHINNCCRVLYIDTIVTVLVDNMSISPRYVGVVLVATQYIIDFGIEMR